MKRLTIGVAGLTIFWGVVTNPMFFSWGSSWSSVLKICSCHDYGPPPPLSPEQQIGGAQSGGGSAGGAGKDGEDTGGKEGGSGSDEKESPVPPVV